MGQFLSCIFRRTPPPLPPLLQLPAEILLLIASRLSSSPESLIALSLTCKTLFSFFDRDALKLCDQSRKDLLLLLEKDLGDRFFYCPTCRNLHRFPKPWHLADLFQYSHCSSCKRYHYCNIFTPNDASSYKLIYIHARLVMNRHFYGSPKGLPLESIAFPAIARNEPDEPFWQETPSARIIGDELFLCITHSLAGRGTTLRDIIDRGWSGICNHLAGDRFRSMPELLEPGEYESNELLLFEDCHNGPGSCNVCLTDYITTVERAEVHERIQDRLGQERPLVDGWSITITAYHQVGQCRDPEDWKWARFIEYPPYRFLLQGPFKERDMALHPPGAIRERWETGGLSV
ncbi:hypothetical protein CFAM422_001987 [Trichoderma lentiforme]|uniref:F-box domain-containing protein n=1 Tax=Trichoderma lentiforme TaxID=1567552 RepID=A0A9P4XNG2_9HYPO|nr:hypothetical protein CFAM422_001987 [Trichoderma lentiforme]